MNKLLETLLTSALAAAIVSGLWNYISDLRRDHRDDKAVRRQVRAAAYSLSKYVIFARTYGTIVQELLDPALAYLTELLKDREIDKALNDRASAAIHEAVDLCGLFVRVAPVFASQDTAAEQNDANQNRLAAAAKPTFDKLRDFFIALDASEIVAEFEQAEAVRQNLERIRNGQG